MSDQPINDGGPAFPVVASTGDPRDGVYCREGITIRDYFAAAALQGMLGECNCVASNDRLAAYAYAAADAMLAARKESTK